MALPAVKQKCYICLEAVTEADYRRELTCSYVACPGSEHAYHEDCINEYLRKLKLPVDRLIGYPCPAQLDNGKPCTGKITSTHHRVPLNQKKKQKRVEAAAAAATAAAIISKHKQPGPKPKEPKQGPSGVGAVTAAMRPAGGAAGLRQVPITNLKSVASALPVVKANVQTFAPGSGAAARLAGTGTASAAIPGWSGAESKASKMSALEQQRAMVAALRAEAKSAAGRSTKGAAAGGATAAVAAAGRNAGSGAMAAPAAGAKGSAGGRTRQQEREEWGDMECGSDDSDVQQYYIWRNREGDSSDSADPGPQHPPPQDFNYMQEEFPAFPTSAAPARSSKTAPATPATANETLSSTSSVESPQAASSALPSDAESPTAPAAESLDETDPIVRMDPVFALEDQTVVVQDEYGNYVPVEDVYGAAPEMAGFYNEAGGVDYYVIIRLSAESAAQQQQASGAVPGVGVEGTPSLHTAASNGGLAEGAAAAETDGQALTDQVSIAVVASVEAHSFAAEPVPQPTMQQQPIVQQEAGGDLDDLFALCLGGAADADLTSELVLEAAAAPAGAVMQQQSLYSVTAGAATAPFPAQGMYGDVGYAGFTYGASARADAVAAAPAGCHESEQVEADDVDSLMQLLCV